MIHQIGKKLRQQIHKFSGELCNSRIGKVSSRFIEEMIFGLSANGSVRLTEIARSLEEDIELHATHKRLSRNLADTNIAQDLEGKILELGAKRISEKTLIIIDPSDLRKKYAKKMEHLATIRDASEKTIGKGYWLCDVVGCEVGSQEITPLVQELWSQESPDFTSENEQILSIVERVRQAVKYQGVLVYDRGGDRREFLLPWTKDSSCHYIIRQRGDRNLLYRGKLISGLNLAESCATPYSSTIIKEKDGKEKTYTIEYGYVPVRLPEWRERHLWLVVAKGFGQKPLMLLTTEPMRRNRKVLWWAIEAYLTRWRVEDTIRFIKQSYDLEDVLVMTYDRLKNMAVLVLAASYFAAVWLGTTSKLKILAMHALTAAKRIFGIPDFRYYALADGIKTIFKRIGKGPLHPRGHESPASPQLSLWPGKNG
jgi:hypothetical protein